jgi:site-specific DNA recombinase
MLTNRIAIAYRRVSTNRQADEGHSLDTQSELIQRYCNGKDYLLQGKYEDRGRSGRTTKQRQGLRQAIDAACESSGILVVYSISRLARSVVDASNILKELKSNDADLAVVDSDLSTAGPYGKLVFQIMTAMAEFESDLISHRVKASHEYRRAHNGYNTHGTQPLGWRLDESGNRVKVPEEQKVLAKVKTAKRGRTYRAAAEYLNKREVPTAGRLRGCADSVWQSASVFRLLKREAAIPAEF